jgi:hypothetical protein
MGPSPELEKTVRTMIAAQMVSAEEKARDA